MIISKNISRRLILKASAAIAITTAMGRVTWAQGSDRKLTMGVISQKTGAFAYAGELVERGARLALEEFNNVILGQEIDLIVRDDEGKPAVGVRKLTEAISSDKLKYFNGNFSSAVGLAELEVARQEMVLQYAAGGSEDFTGGRCSAYTFQWSAHAYTALRATLEYVRQAMPEKKKIYTLTADYAFGHSLLRYAEIVAKELGFELVGNDNHPSGERQYTQYFTKALSLRPDIVCLLTAGADAVSAIRQFNSFGVDSIQVVGPWTLEVEQLHELSPSMRSGMILGLNYYHDIDTPVNKKFVERYSAKHNAPPSYAATYGYDSFRTILMAMEKAKSTEVSAVMKTMEGMEFESVFGPTSIDAKTHQTIRPYYVVECKKPENSTSKYDIAAIKAQGSTLPPSQYNECKREI